jgi:hypothetical protein
VQQRFDRRDGSTHRQLGPLWKATEHGQPVRPQLVFEFGQLRPRDPEPLAERAR